MKIVYKWATIITLLISVFLLLILIFFVEPDKIAIFAVLSGVIASMIVMAISNFISWLLAIKQEMTMLKFTYTELLDTYSDALHIILYSATNMSPSVNDLISKYQELNNQIQRLFILHKRDKMPDYYKLQCLIENISTVMKKFNNSHKVIKTEQEKFNAYTAIMTFISSNKELDKFMVNIRNLQDKSIVEQNKNSQV